MTTAAVQNDTLLATVRTLLLQLRATAAATDRDRQVPKDIVTALRAAGVYGMLLPCQQLLLLARAIFSTALVIPRTLYTAST